MQTLPTPVPGRSVRGARDRTATDPGDEGVSTLVVPQCCVLVLPSTGVYDSRAYRIASTLAARGHDVTVLARLGPGLAADERHPAGYRVVRVAVSAIDGLPGPIRGIARIVHRRRGRRPSAAFRPRDDSADVAGPTPKRSSSPPQRTRMIPRAVGPVRRGLASAWRLAAIGLTIRSQGVQTRRQAPRADLVHAMAYMGIPIGLSLGRRDRAATVYDARDIYVDAANLARLPRPARWLFGRFERGWARQASRVMTVNTPYAEVMAGRFGVPMPVVVLNCSYRRSADGRGRRFHDALGLADDARIVLYHGGLSRDRGIEQLILALPDLPPEAHVVLMGYGALEPWLVARAEDPTTHGRLHVLPAVPPTELHDWVGSADVAVMAIQPTTLNHRLTTPNKLFEAMAAGVPVVASDLPGMGRIVRETGCGLLVDPTDPAAIARAVSKVLGLTDAERAAMVERARTAHLDTYSWESQAEKLLAEYGRLTGRPW